MAASKGQVEGCERENYERLSSPRLKSLTSKAEGGGRNVGMRTTFIIPAILAASLPSAIFADPPTFSDPITVLEASAMVTKGNTGGLSTYGPTYFTWTDGDWHYSERGNYNWQGTYGPAGQDGTWYAYLQAGNSADGTSPYNDVTNENFPYTLQWTFYAGSGGSGGGG